MDDLLIHGTERHVWGYIDVRGLWGSVRDWPPGVLLFPFDAECRGYDMALFKEPYPITGGIYHR